MTVLVRSTLSVLVLGLATVACGTATGLALDEPTTLPVHARMDVSGALFAVRFAGVSADSRCPRAVMCVWAGDAVVELDLVAADDSAHVALHTNGAVGPTSATFLGFVVELVSLDPLPDTAGAIDPDAYVATVRVQRE